ncbi:MAG: N-acetylneuraminate synthase [Tannerellaceae bacterium]|nr:N-acetylneuraminate synthase [Tannerellaceae bacterium]
MRKTLIIAEAGVNHNGSIELAKKLIDAGADAGVDYVKFQTFNTQNLVLKQAEKAEYQKRNLNNDDTSQYAMLQKLELTKEEHFELINYSKQKGVNFFSTAFDLESIDFLATLNLGFWKIPSGEITNYPYLKRIAQHKEPVILSTGMSTLEEITDAIDVLKSFGVRKEMITVLHCNTEYPTPYADVNLLAMQTLCGKLNVSVGYSDHTLGIEVPIAAVALGATIIEKHFTLDRNMEGPDHKASLEPTELKSMVRAIRNIEQALGSKHKIISSSEKGNREVARKSIVAARDILEGEVFTEENLTVKRPGKGISPMKWKEIIGTKSPRHFKTDDQITYS